MVIEQHRLDIPGCRVCLVEVQATRVQLVTLKVWEDFQGLGYGSRALTKLKQMYNRPIYLYAVPDDPERWADLEKFYKRNGFVQDEQEEEAFVWKPRN